MKTFHIGQEVVYHRNFREFPEEFILGKVVRYTGSLVDIRTTDGDTFCCRWERVHTTDEGLRLALRRAAGEEVE